MDLSRFARLELLLVLLLITGSALVFSALGKKEFWHDETYSLFNAAGLTTFGQPTNGPLDHEEIESRSNLTNVVRSCLLNDGGNGILHAVFMHGWIQVAPHTTSWLRLPSALFGLSVILLVLFMTYDLFQDRRVALLAAVFCAWSVLLVQSSIELRGYTLATALSLASTWCLFRILLRRAGPYTYVGHAVFALLAMLAHYSTAYILLGQAIVFLIFLPERQVWAKVTLGTVGVVLGIFLWMQAGGAEGYQVLAARNAAYTEQARLDPTINTYFQSTRASTLVEGIVLQSLYASGNGLQFAGPQLRYIMLLLAIPVLLLAMAWFGSEQRDGRKLVLGCMVMGSMAMFYASGIAVNTGHTISFFPRYALFSAPFWCILMALGAGNASRSIRWRIAGVLAGSAALVISIWSCLISYYPTSQQIIGPDRYADHRASIRSTIERTPGCTYDLVHRTYTSAYLVNLMAWDDNWTDLAQRIDTALKEYSVLDIDGPCPSERTIVVARDGKYPRSEPKDPTDDVTW